MSNQGNEGCGIWGMLALILIVFCAILSAFENKSQPADGKYYPASSDEQFQREYAKQRIKMEGYSDADAATAADAIMKFQRAQQNNK